jgi:hypothetical protein
MKSHFSFLSAVVLFLGLGTTHASVQLTTAHQRSEPRKETFIGEVTRNPEIDYDSMDQLYRHIICDQTRKMNYFLDDNGKAEKYDEKKVEIEGTLERKDTAIHVDSIKALD